MEKIIEIKNLTKNYGKFQAVKDVSMQVFKGDVYGFLGPNGAGKSTTIRCMLSLIKPSSGSIKIFDKDLSKNRNEILSKIGCIVEKPDFYKYLSAAKNIEIFGRISGADVSSKNIHKTLEFVGLKGREKDKVSGFSHGMKQRLGIAQTLIHNPDLIILDEPTTGLDPQGIIDIRNLILQLKNEQNKTILLSSHILSEIELIANRMVIINKGVTVVEGEVKTLLNQEELIVVFETDNALRATEILGKEIIAEVLSETHFQAHIHKDEISPINLKLLQNGLQVFGIETKRKLEDYFLKLINA
ncbi:MAG: ABC transporter ATP-binding protein [Bacteroidota bacterium]|nr:ABC transporter ATP-binding protein [Bacteroidota bacterium]